jgi:DNA topoisomerase III
VLQMIDGETKPPTLLSESDLISKMDQNGIGTDATIHEHIKTVQERNYAYKQ